MSTGSESRSAEAVAERFEWGWALLIGGIVFLLLAIIVFTAVRKSSLPPSRVETIDVTTLHQAGEFVEENLGTTLDSRGDVVVRMVAGRYAFNPSCVVIPQGVPVTFRATSNDVVHGFQVIGTNMNSMVVPGYVSTFRITLNELGERSMPCHEYCGVGHASMWARVKVVPQAELNALLRAHRRVRCV